MAYADLRGVKHIVDLGDTHTGSTVALCPPDAWEFDDDWGLVLGNAHKMLWSCWRYFWDEFVPAATMGEPYAIIHKGDIIEGNHHGGHEIFQPVPREQRKLAMELLEPETRKTKHLYVIRGTEAHDGPAHVDVEEVAEKLGAHKLDGHSSHRELWLDWEGTVLHYTHHVGAGRTIQTQASAIARELMKSLIEASQWEDLKPHVISRGHVHREVTCSFPARHGRMLAFTTPSWKLKDSYSDKNFSLNRPYIGGTVLSRDWTGDIIPRHFTWAPLSRGPVPVTVDALKRAISRGTNSSRNSTASATKTVKRKPS